MLLSALCLLLCVSMLVGSTFAWFTDNASTGVNTIQSGNLEIALVDAAGNSLEGQKLSFAKAPGAPAGEEVLFEPGATYQLSGAKIVNLGNLAVKFKVTIKGLEGKAAKLADVLEVGSVVNGQFVSKGVLSTLNADADGIAHGILLPAGAAIPAGAGPEYSIETAELPGLALHMMESADNNYMGLTLDGIGITVQAGQATFEYDSLGNQYDKDAAFGGVFKVWDGTVGTLSDDLVIDDGPEFAAFAASVNDGDTYAGKTVKLNANIDLAGNAWTTISSFAGTFDGQGNAIANLKDAALFGTVTETGAVKNLNLQDVSASSNIDAFLVKSLQGTVESCSMTNAVVTTDTHNSAGMIRTATGNAVVDKCSVNGFTLTVNSTADNGDKVGALVGFASGANVRISNSTVSNVTLNGGQKTKQWGGLVGFLQYASVENCSATNVKIYVSGYAQSVGGFVGAVADGTLTNCRVAGVALDIGTGGHAGGFCGYTGQTNYYIFDNCHVSGLSATLRGESITGLGGFSGRAAFTTTIKNCSAEGSISAPAAAIASGAVKNLVGQDYVSLDPSSLVTENNTVNVTIS